jgi:hypothetical protein
VSEKNSPSNATRRPLALVGRVSRVQVWSSGERADLDTSVIGALSPLT